MCQVSACHYMSSSEEKRRSLNKQKQKPSPLNYVTAGVQLAQSRAREFLGSHPRMNAKCTVFLKELSFQG